MRLPVIDCRGLIEFCRAFEQHNHNHNHNHKHKHVTAADQKQPPNYQTHHHLCLPSSSKKHQITHHSLNPFAHPFCEHIHSPFAALDIVLLLLVLGALGFLIVPCFQLIICGLLELFPMVWHVVGDAIRNSPVAYVIGLTLAITGTISTVAIWEILEIKARKCGKPHCKGLRKGVEFDIQLESEDCVKYLPPTAAYGVQQLELGEDRKELEAELKRMAPLNGRTVLIFRAPCGCPAGRLEVWGHKKIRRIKK